MSQLTHNSFESGILDALQAMICVKEPACNYLDICRNAVDKGDDYALKIIPGIRKVFDEYSIVKVNSSFKKTFGYADEFIDGKKLDDLITPENKRQETVLNSDKAFRGFSLQMESVRKKKDNTEIPVVISSVPIISDDDPNVIKKLHEVQGRVCAIAKIHQTLYSDEEVVDIRFDKYMESLLVSIPVFQYRDNISDAVKLKTDEFTLNLNQAVPAGLIINENLSSSINEQKAENHSLTEVIVKTEDNMVGVTNKGVHLIQSRPKIDLIQINFSIN